MRRFLSSIVNNVDSKGRVSVPAPFRQVLAARDITDLYALQSIVHPAIDVGGDDLLTQYERWMEEEAPFSQAYDDLSLLAYGDGTYLKFDPEGRITVNDFIRAHTGITDRVLFVGRRDYFQLWEPSRFEAYRAEMRQRMIARQSSRGVSQSTPE
ncbi:division/cell wall cluster transcriptional repressor MraZ [Consotaella aegiceratis]|uniref:division/cell wall cluster transcriptional repressor MraZ n=1 Tax=Consotaella aegiceratis TaxID=3097961 RepID=UPI002F407808